MNVCFPVEEDLGLSSPLCPHFGSAPMLLVVDTTTKSCRPLANQFTGHGMCGAVSVLQSASVDTLVVGGIGAGALSKLAAINVAVYSSNQFSSVGQALDALERGELQRVGMNQACGGGHHSHGEGCAH